MERALIQLNQIIKSFHSKTVFDEISFSIHEGDRIALIGENGVGKTTLLNLISGEVQPDQGSIVRQEGLTIGALAQQIIFPGTVAEYLEDTRLHKLEVMMEEATLQEDWMAFYEEYEKLGGYRKKVLKSPVDSARLVSTLSGGEKTQIALIKAFFDNPDLLLLDEPTNHLDEQMLGWVEKQILERKGATLLISHDRAFLNRVVRGFIELKKGKISFYQGNYDQFLLERKRALEREIVAYEEQKGEKKALSQKIKGLTYSKKGPSLPTDRDIMAYDARGEKHQRSVAHRLEQLKERFEKIENNPLSHPNPSSIRGFAFESIPLVTSLTFHRRAVFKGDRILIQGPNGSGKTTLLKQFLEEYKDRSSLFKIGYLDQEVVELPMDKTPFAYFEEKYGLKEHQVRAKLHQMAFQHLEGLTEPFSCLSIGQRKRLMLLSLILEKPNLLVLDEPTNHLDFMTLEAFEKALLAFEGAILAASHDRYFTKKIATQVWTIGYDLP